MFKKPQTEFQLEDPSQSPALMDYTIETLKTSHLVEGNPAKGEQTGLITPRRM